MSFARLKLIIASLAFLGWLSWLGVTVANKGIVQIVSPGQLTAATSIVVATVSVNESGDASPKVQIQQTIRGEPLVGEIEIERLDKAVTPLPINGSRKIGRGEFVLPLVRKATTFAIAGLPRSPGVEPSEPTRPTVYPWTDDVRKQLQKYGILKSNSK